MPKYKSIAEKLADSIRKGAFKTSGLPSESAICCKYAISRITARAALKLLEEAGAISVIPGKGRVISDFAGEIDLSRKKAVKSIACICTSARMIPAYGIIYNRIRELCAAQNISDSLFFTEGKSIEPFADQLSTDRFSGIISIGVSCRRIIEELSNLSVETVYAAYDHPLARFSVSTDDYAGGWLAAEHLLSHGHRNILLVDKGNVSDPAFARRRDGFMKRMYEDGPDAYKISFSRPPDGGHEFSDAMKKNKPSAIFMTTDMLIPGIFSELHHMKLKVPDDISILGYDNLINNAESSDFRLDSFAQNWAAIAENAFSLATNPIKKENIRIAIKPVLKVHDTVLKKENQK